MAFQPIPNTVLASIRGTLDGQLIENTLAFKYATSISPSIVAEVGDNCANWWHDQIMPNLSDEYALREVYVLDVSSETGPTYISNLNAGDVGGYAIQSMPGNVAATVTLRTALRGRSYRGRNFIPAIPISIVTGVNGISSTWADAITTAYGNLRDHDYVVGDLVVISRYHDNALRTPNGVATVVTTIDMNLVLDSMRRRLPGRGV